MRRRGQRVEDERAKQEQGAYFQNLDLLAAPPLLHAQQDRNCERSDKARERRDKPHQYKENNERRQAEKNIHEALLNCATFISIVSISKRITKIYFRI